MYKVTGASVNAFLLVALLVVFGVRLAKNLREEILYEKQVDIELAQPMAFRAHDAIDINGNHISFYPNGHTQVIAFALHRSTLIADIDFWSRVESALGSATKTSLVGYCDGDSCAESIRQSIRKPQFKIVMYGEVGSSQAVFDADHDGTFILASERSLGKTMPWRSSGINPDSVARMVIR